MGQQKDLGLIQGKTFSLALRWETEPMVYKPITEIDQAAPVRLKVPSHGLPNGWRAAVTNVKGMTEINAQANKVRDTDYRPATVIDTDYIEFNDINAAGYKPYISGGYVQYRTPVDISGYAARMMIKDKVGGTVLFELTTENDRIVIDDTDKTVTLNISATETAEFTWKKGVYELEMVSPGGVVTALLTGTVVVTREVTV